MTQISTIEKTTHDIKQNDRVMLIDGTVVRVADNKVHSNMRLVARAAEKVNVLLYVYTWTYLIDSTGLMYKIRFTNKQKKDRHAVASELLQQYKEFYEQQQHAKDGTEISSS